MKRLKNKRSNNEISRDTEFKRTIISAITVVTIIAVGCIIFIILQETPYHNESVDLWKEAFEEVENDKIGVVFNSLSTTSDEYIKLRDACNNYIDKSNDVDLSLELKLDISEDTFVDNNLTDNTDKIQKESKEVTEENKVVETGPLYFDNILILRYIDDNGNLSVVSGIYNESNEIEVLRQDEIRDAVELNKSLYNKEGTDDTAIYDNEPISEDDYLYHIANCIHNLLLANTDESENNAIMESLYYFTSDGKDSVLNSRYLLKEDYAEAILKVCLCGKSDTSKVQNDRIYLQFDIINNSGDVLQTLNIIVKLNSNLKVFDIDIV